MNDISDMSNMSDFTNNVERETKKGGATFVIVTLYFIATLFIFYWIYTHQKSQKIEVFDLRETLTIFNQQVAQKKFSAPQIAILSEKFSAAIETATKKYANKNNVILVISDAMVAGAKSATLEIQKLIAAEMKQVKELEEIEKIAKPIEKSKEIQPILGAEKVAVVQTISEVTPQVQETPNQEQILEK